jgi:hypothetical protein
MSDYISAEPSRLLVGTLQERGLDKDSIYDLLLYYTLVVTHTHRALLSDLDSVRTSALKSMIEEFVKSNPLTISTILREK